MVDAALSTYLHDLTRVRSATEATPELSLREPLLVLVRTLAGRAGRADLLIAPEAAAGEVGQPDIFIKDGPRLVGFIETKAPGADLGHWLKQSDQARRYLKALPNWMVTDYYRFIFIRDGQPVAQLQIGDPGGAQSSAECSWACGGCWIKTVTLATF